MLEIDNISKVYANGVTALRNVTLNVAQGEIVAIVGGSGCGKSTLLRLISGLDRASSGSIRIEGAAVTSPHPAIGIIFQEPRLLPWLNVADNVAFGLASLTKPERRHRVHEVLRRVGLRDYNARWPRELSGGQSQRVAIARALVTQPSVLLLDEPFSALDAFTRVELQEHLAEIWQETRPTLVLVTHDIEEAVALGSRVVVLHSSPGRLAASFEIGLSRPRNRLSSAFDDEKRRVLQALNLTLAREPRSRSALVQTAVATE